MQIKKVIFLLVGIVLMILMISFVFAQRSSQKLPAPGSPPPVLKTK